MNRLVLMVSFFIALSITGIFFYKTIVFGHIPFPGDLLIAEYKPWQSYSYLGYVPGSYPNKAQYFDTLRQIYPWTTLGMQQIKKIQVPLWNPYNFSGTPLLANFQSALFYPLKIFYFFLPQHIAWTILVILQPFLGLFFMYAYSQKMKLSSLASLFAAVSYAFSSFMMVWLQYNTIGHVIIWLPLILLAIEHLKENRDRRWMVILILSIVFSLLAGHPQVFFYLLIFCLMYGLVRITKQNQRIIFLLSVTVSMGICAFQLIPGLELLKYAARSPLAYKEIINKILIQPWQLIMLIIPDFFGNPATRSYWLSDTYVGKVTSIGIVPLFFFLAMFRSHFELKKFFLISLTIVLVLITNNPMTQLLYRINIPLLTSSSSSLMTFLFNFLLALLCGYGIDAWQKEKHTMKKLTMRSIQVIGFLIFLWILVSFLPLLRSPDILKHLTVTKHAILYASGLSGVTLVIFALAITHKKYMTSLLLFLLIIHIADLFWAFNKFNPFSPKELIFPATPVTDYVRTIQGINRHWGYGSATIEANFATQLFLYSPDGYDPLYPKWYGEFIGASGDGKIHTAFTRVTRSDATVTPGYGEKGLMNNIYRLKILDTIGTKYLLDRIENGSTTQTFPPERFSEIYNKDGWKILENHNASPRIFLASSYKVFRSNEEFEQIFFDKNFNPTKTILLEQSLQRELQNPINKDQMQLQTYTPNEIGLTTTTDGDRLLFLSDTYYPGWKAFIDNTETKIYRADYTFRALYVPKGEHRIRFTYQPISFQIGATMSTISILIALTSVGILSWKKYEKR